MAVRTQIYLDADQRSRIGEIARQRGLTMAEVIRRAIDAFADEEDDLDATFGAAPGIGARVPARDEWDRAPVA